MQTTWRSRRFGLAVAALCAVGGVAVLAQSSGRALQIPGDTGQAAETSSGGFRQFPGGKLIPNLRAGMTPRDAAVALRADADSQLPEGFRAQDDGEPVVTPIGNNSLFRFGLEYGGVKLASGSDYVAVVGRNGRLLSSRFRNIPLSVDATTPTVDPATAQAVATDHARTRLSQSGTLTASTPELEIWVDEQQQGLLSWSILVREQAAGTVRAATQYRVAAAGSPAVLSSENAIRYQTTIHVEADVWQLSPNQPTVVSPLSDVSVFRAGSSVAFLTNLNGDVVFPTTIPPGETLSSQLRGPFAFVRSVVAPAFLTSSVTTTSDNDTLHVSATTELTLAQTTAFYWTTYANRWVRDYLPFLSTTPTALDGIEVSVNENIPCNAFSTGESLHFGRAASLCNNMAAPTIIVHEFGHSLHGLLTTSFEGGYSEGFGDALAAFVTEQPCVGLGAFRTSESCFRNAAEVTTWPVSSSDPHQQGKPYAQFAWILATNLGIATATELILGAAAAGASDIPDAVHLSFVVADDDGLLGTCSPNQKVLEAAADSRHLPRPPDCRPAGDNTAPTASDDEFTFIEDEGSREVDLVANDTDADGDRLVVTDVQQGLLGTLDCAPMPCRYTPRPDASGAEAFTYTVVDTYGGSATANVRIQITSIEDVVSIFGPGDVQGQESEPTPVSVSVFDPDGPPVTLRWFAGTTGSSASAPCVFAAPFAASTTMTCTHEGTFPFGVIVTQGSDQIAGPLGTAEIANAHPSVLITSPVAGTSISENASVDVAASFEDGPNPGTHTCEISWGDGTTTAGVAGAGTCTGSHVYPAGSAGTRKIEVSILDPGFTRGTASIIVEVTPTSSPTCVRGPDHRCTVVGAGTLGRTQPILFEFTAWLRKTGAGGQMLLVDGKKWRFATASVRALTITGNAAVFSGTGSVNGRAGFGFEATIADNRRFPAQSGASDTLRIVVRTNAGAIERVIEGDVARGDIVID